MKIVKETIRKYYKYQYSSWTQPVLTSNTSNNCTVTSSAAYGGYPAYYAMDGVTTDSWFPNTTTGWWQIVFPEKIFITGLTHVGGGYNQNSYSISGRYYADSSKTIPIGDAISGTYSQGQQVQISNIPNEGIYTDTIYFDKTGGSENAGIGELIITATQRTTTTGTSSDYDYYEDVEVYEAVKENVRKYYKYDTQNPQYNYTPVGTITNNNGVLSGFTTSNYASISNSFNPQSSEWEMIIPYITTNISSAQYILGTDNYGVCIGINDSSKARIYLSSNNSSWDIAEGTTSAISLSANTQYYFKLTRTSSSYVLSVSTDKTNYTTHITVSSSATIPSSQLKFGVSRSNVQPATYGSIDLNDAQITIGGSIWWEGKTYPAIPATSSDYDFYKDVDVYEAVKF